MIELRKVHWTTTKMESLNNFTRTIH